MAKHPHNVLLIFTDQQRQDAVGVYGNRFVQTPNIDALADEGCGFTNAICAQPVCTPSRASLLTGAYAHTHGCVKNNWELTTEIPTLAEILGRQGYRCGYIGKWHLGNEVIPQRGFEGFYRGTEDEYMTDADREAGLFSSYYHFLKENGLDPEDMKRPQPFFTREEACALSEAYGRPAYMASEADAFLKGGGDEPFLLAISFLEPHPPYHGPYDGLYNPDDMPLPANYENNPVEDWPRRTQAFRRFYYEVGHNGVATRNPDEVRDTTARYYGLCSLLDTYVGRILTSLRRSGRYDDTIIIFTSDHGDMLGSHQIMDKGVMFEEALKVPFILRHPAMPLAGRWYSEMMNNVDVAPTILDMLGVPIPDAIQGRSFLPLLRGEKNPLPDFAVSEWCGLLQNMHARHPIFRDVLDLHVRCVVTERWKLIVAPGDKNELYDLRNDPLETANAIADPGSRWAVEDLYERLLKWQKDTADTLSLPAL